MVTLTSILTIGYVAVSAVYGKPFDSSCSKYEADLTKLATEVPKVDHFCKAFVSGKRTKSVVKGVSAERLDKVCECAVFDPASSKVVAKASSKASSGSIAGHAAASVCNNAQLAKILSGIKDVTYFCQHFNPSQWQHSSPIFGISTAAIQQACQCVLSASSASVSVLPSSTASSAAPLSTRPSGPAPMFSFCPRKASELGPFKTFCNTPLWKLWACSCSTVAQACFSTTSMSWCAQASYSVSSSSYSAPVTSIVPTFFSTMTTPITTIPSSFYTTTTTDAESTTPTTTDDGSATTTSDGSVPSST